MQQALSGFTGRFAGAAVALGATAWGMQSCLFTVEPGYRGILFDRFSGIKNKVYGEGVHFAVPMIQWPIFMDARIRPRTTSSVTQTKDMQQASVQVRVLLKPTESELPKIYQQVGEDWDNRVLPSIANEVAKAVIAQYDAEQLLSQREKVSQEIRDSLTRRAAEFNIELEDVSIVGLVFSKEFSRAIEDKQVAEQMAERAKFVVQIREHERQAAVISAEGQAEAAEIITGALQASGPGLVDMRRIETAQEIAATLSNAPNITYLPGSKGGNQLLLNVGR